MPLEVLNKGRNELKLTCDFHEGINIEAIYLIGNFGVRLEGRQATLTHLPGRVAVGDITTQGLPFYGGPLTYYVPGPAWKKHLVTITVPAFEAACINVVCPNVPNRMIAWPPYQATIDGAEITNKSIGLEVVLTRRNTFGPLHQIPLRVGGYGPSNFTTSGSEFSEPYMLYPAGLLQAPVFSW